MDKQFYTQNRENYFNKIENNSLSLFFSGLTYPKSADEDFEFEVNKNFYYLTGINQANVVLAIIKRETPKTILFIEKNDPVLSKWVGRKLEKEEASEISGISEVRYRDEFEDFFFNLFNAHRNYEKKPEVLYLDLKRNKNPDLTSQEIIFSRKFKDDYPEISVKNAYDIVIGLRTIKRAEEIELIKESLKTTKGGLETLMKMSRPGIYEYQLESYFDQYIKMNGQKTHAFKTICASGKNAAILHYVKNNKVMEAGELVLFDLGARTDFYVSDISRTIPVDGKFTPRCREVYQEVLDVNKKCIEYLKPGITWKEFNEYAKELLVDALKRLGLIKENKELSKYYWHSIGHFIGLDTHDPGNYEETLQPGMVLTVEPGIYIEEEGIGVRIEDNILITAEGVINLSADIIKEIDDIEKFMAAAK
ncbi:MAG TPA: aminopeptidase P family protein [Acholeplasmataceae bacterium]|jgi:Xaa-Pro aminopeptidase|nr:aminopeptidase P family protein [Acholeplasmataceae bacterium]